MRPWAVLLGLMCLGACVSTNAATQNDVIVGNGTSGPYTLTYKSIASASVSVSKNSASLVSGLDYTVDGSQGQVTFTRPLATNASAVVQYTYDPATAQPAGGKIVLPVQVDVAQTDHQDVFFSAKYQQSTDQSSTAPGNVTLGVGSLWHGSGHNQAGVRLFLAPQVAAGGQYPAGPAATGLALATTADAGHGSLFTLGFNRAALGVAADPEAGIQPGQQLMNMGLHVAPVSYLHADVGYKQAAAVDDSIPATTVSSAAVTVVPAQAVQVTVRESQTNQGAEDLQQTGVGVAVAKDKNLTVNTGIDNYRDQTASHQVASVSSRIRPAPKLEIAAAYQSRFADANDADIRHRLDTTDMKVSWQPGTGLKVIGSYGVNPTDPNGDPVPSLRRGLGLESSLGALRLTGGYDWTEQTGSPQDATQLRLGVGWTFSRHGQVLGAYTQSIGPQYTVQSPWLTTYSLGYQHSLGETFSVSLMGTLNRYPGVEITTMPIYSTTANVGAKF
jgi:hypothetical protein